MTIEQDKKIELAMLRRMSQMSIQERFGGKVESVSIEYAIVHDCFAGRATESNIICKQKVDAADFFIRCHNHECTKRYFNLGDIVVNMYLKGQTTYEGAERCSGQTAPDHPKQQCGGLLSYKITLQYNESCREETHGS